MRKAWLWWLVGSVLVFNLGLGTLALAQGPSIGDGGLTFDAPAKAVGGSACNAAKSLRSFVGGAIVAVIFVIGIFMFLAGNSRGGFGLLFTGFVGAVLLATMPTWISTLIAGCTL